MSGFDYPVSKKDGIFSIDLGRPEEGNSLTRGMMRRLADVIRVAGLDPDNRVLVIHGSGPQFCKGRDGRGETTVGLTPYEIRVQMMGSVLGVYEAINAAPINSHRPCCSDPGKCPVR
jgi:enoyl-CoA hydratase/carnithine racemase